MKIHTFEGEELKNKQDERKSQIKQKGFSSIIKINGFYFYLLFSFLFLFSTRCYWNQDWNVIFNYIYTLILDWIPLDNLVKMFRQKLFLIENLSSKII